MQTLAELCGWSPSVAPQTKYSLVERTVEHEFIPMAVELGLGVLPWSPLDGGFAFRQIQLHQRRSVAQSQCVGDPQGRGRLVRSRDGERLPNDRSRADVAWRTGATLSQMAPAWTLTNPAVTSSVMDARTVAQAGEDLRARRGTFACTGLMAERNSASEPTFSDRLMVPADGASACHRRSVDRLTELTKETAMKSFTSLLAVLAALTPVMAHAACSSDGAASPGLLHREWILVGWEKRAGDPPFSFENKLGRFYDFTSPDVLLYDDLSPGRRIATSAAAYGAMWMPPFSGLREAHHRVTAEPQTIVSTDLATSTLEFAARLTDADGGIAGVLDRSTLVWRCTDNQWRIVREHNSSRFLRPDELGRLFMGRQ